MFKNKFGKVRSGWLIAFSGLMVLFGQTMFMMPGITMVSLLELSNEHADLALSTENMSPLLLVMTQGAGTFGGIAATLVVFRAVNKKNPNKLGIQGPPLDMLFGLLLGAGAMTVIFFVLLETNQITLMNQLSNPAFSMYTWAFLLVFILTGFFEEMFFRGYIMQTMLERGNKRWVIYIVSAVVFGLAHISNPNVQWIGIVNIILVGFLFAYMFETTKSLMLPIGFHITWNFFQGSVYGFPVSGLAPHGLYDVNVSTGYDLITGGSFGIEGGLMATLLIGISFVLTYLYTRKRQINNGTLIPHG